MVDKDKVKELLTELLTDVASKAREDSLSGNSDIGSIYKRDARQDEELGILDAKMVEEAIKDIDRATATKEGARRIVNAVMVAAKAVAKLYLPPTP